MKILFHVWNILLLLLGMLFIGTGYVAYRINDPVFQTKVAARVTQWLSKKAQAEVKIGSVNISFFHHIQLHDILVRDRQSDTLLAASQADVAIGWLDVFKSHYDITDITLDKSEIYLHRPPDSDNFNYQFLIDAFSSNKPKDTASKIDLQLGTLLFNQVHFVMKDEPNYMLMDFSVPQLKIDAKSTDFNTPVFNLHQVLLREADLQIFKLIEPPNLPSDTFPQPDTAIGHINTKPIQLYLDDLKFENCRFRYNDLNEKPADAGFDGFHQDFQQLNLDFANAKLIKDTIISDIRNMNFKEKSGFQVTGMSAHARVTPEKAEASDLLLKTPTSSLSNYFALVYQNFHSFLDFNNKVKLDIRLNDTRFNPSDMAYFISGMDAIKPVLLASGRIAGPIVNLRGTGLNVNGGRLTNFTGDLSVSGLPDINNSFISVQVKSMTTDANDLKTFLGSPDLPEQLYNAGKISFSGSFTGFYNDFVAFGKFNTAVGALQSDLSLKFKNGLDSAEYEGSLSASNLQLDRLLKTDSLLGNISFDAQIAGKGMTQKSLNSSFKGAVSQFEFNRYNYQDITVNGNVKNNYFDGILTVNDPNVRLNFEGSVDARNDLPLYHFTAEIDSAHLLALHLIDNDYTLTTNATLNLRGKTIDDAVGTLNATGTQFETRHQLLRLDTMTLLLAQTNNERDIELRTPIGYAYVKGQVTLSQFPQSLMAFAHHYFTPIKFKDTITAKQDFDFDIKAENLDMALPYFVSDVDTVSGLELSGHVNTDANSIISRGSLPFIKYRNFFLQNVLYNFSSDGTALNANITADELQVGDSTRIRYPIIGLTASNDSVHFNIKTTQQSAENYLDLQAVFRAAGSGFQVHVLPSVLILQNRNWQLDPNNLLLFANGQIEFQSFTFFHEDESLNVSNLNKNPSSTSLKLTMKNLPIGDLYQFVAVNDLQLDGFANGEIDLLDITRKFRISGNLDVRQVKINDITIQQFSSSIDYNPDADQVSVNATFSDSLYKIRASGLVSFADSVNQLKLQIGIEKCNMRLAQSFMSDILSNTDGNASGLLFLSGSINAPYLTGKLNIPYLKTTIGYLQTTYSMKNQEIIFNNDYIDIGRIRLYDARGDSAIATGQIVHENLKNFNFDISLRTKKFQCMNTRAIDNSLFYGSAEASGLVQFTGPLNNLLITASVTTMAGTSISIPISSGVSISDNSLVRFVSKKDTVAGKAVYYVPFGGLRLNFNIVATPDAKIQLIFDQKSGDIIQATGEGNIRMEIDTKGAFNMYGTYTINDGNYLFTQLNFFNKYFTIEKGGTVTWYGDPYSAQINISAIYSTHAIVADLVSGSSTNYSSQDLQDLQQRIIVNVYLILTGSLLQPDISFQIKTPDVNQMSNIAYAQILKVNQDDQLLKKQVFGLLVLGRFIPETIGAETNSGGSGTTLDNTVSEFLLSQAGNLLSSINKNLDVKLNYQAYNVNANEGDINSIQRHNEFQAAVSYNINNRIKLNVGGNVNFGGQTNPTSNGNNIAGDFAISYTLTPDGRIALNAFSLSQYDVIDERYKQKNGISISIQKDFDKLKELFSKTPKSKKPTLQEPIVQPQLGADEMQPLPVK